MYHVQKDHMASKLASAWAFLRGNERHFEAVSPLELRPGERVHAIVLPVYVPDHLATYLLAVSLLIDNEEAVGIASHMFGLPESDVQTEDVRDASQEACNVLGSCLAGNLIGDDNQALKLEIGLPQTMDISRFMAMRRQSDEGLTFQSEDWDGCRVAVTIFDAVDTKFLEQ